MWPAFSGADVALFTTLVPRALDRRRVARQTDRRQHFTKRVHSLTVHCHKVESLMRQYDRIDAYAHFAPLGLNRHLEEANGGPGPFSAVFAASPETYDPIARLELMDRLEVDAHVLSPI